MKPRKVCADAYVGMEHMIFICAAWVFTRNRRSWRHRNEMEKP